MFSKIKYYTFLVVLILLTIATPIIYSSENSTLEEHWVTIRETECDLNGDSSNEIVRLSALGLYESHGKFAMEDNWQTWNLTVNSEVEKYILHNEGNFGYMDIFLTGASNDELPSIILVFDNWFALRVYMFTYSLSSSEFQKEEIISLSKGKEHSELLLDYRWIYQGIAPEDPPD